MDERELVKKLLKDIGWSQERLAEEAHLGKQSNVTGLLNNNKTGMRVDKLYACLDAMGFELVVRDKRDKRKEYVITKERCE